MNNGNAYLSNTPNFLGMLFNSNINKTQFLTLIGGTDGSNAEITTNPEFPISVRYAMSDGSQPAITEAQSVGAANPTYFGLSQDVNVIQIFQEDVTVSKVETTSLEVPKLKKSYLIAKKLKITFYKIITYLPRMFNGSWKKRKVEADN